MGFTCMLRPAFGVSASSVRLGWAAALKSLILLVSVILSFSQYLPYLPCNFQFSLSSCLCSAKIYHLDPCPHPPLSCGLSSIVPSSPALVKKQLEDCISKATSSCLSPSLYPSLLSSCQTTTSCSYFIDSILIILVGPPVKSYATSKACHLISINHCTHCQDLWRVGLSLCFRFLFLSFILIPLSSHLYLDSVSLTCVYVCHVLSCHLALILHFSL